MHPDSHAASLSPLSTAAQTSGPKRSSRGRNPSPMEWKAITGVLRNKTLVLALVAIFLTGHNATVHAGGYEWGGLGSRAQSMGGAFTGLADDWTAIYWNPAGLTQLRGSELGFEFFSPHVTIKDGSSLSNLTPGAMDTRYQIDTFAQFTGLEPTRFDKEKVDLHFYIPNGLGGYWQWKGFTMGAGLYSPVGHYFDWEDTVRYGAGTIDAKLFHQFSLTAGNFSIARQITPRLSLGAGVELAYGRLAYEAEKTVSNSGISDYRWDFASKGDGFGVEGTFGFLYKITDRLNLGGVYRTGATIRLKGDADTHLSLAGLAEESDFVQKFRHPSTWGLGLAYKLRPNLTLTTDWQRTNWSEFGVDVDYDRQGAVLRDRRYSADWKDSNRYRFGIEYQPTDRWSLRGGYSFDQSPLPDKAVSFSNIADVDRHSASLGAGHKWPNGWGVDLLYSCCWGSRSAGGTDYEQRVHGVGFTISYKW